MHSVLEDLLISVFSCMMVDKSFEWIAENGQSALLLLSTRDLPVSVFYCARHVSVANLGQYSLQWRADERENTDNVIFF